MQEEGQAWQCVLQTCGPMSSALLLAAAVTAAVTLSADGGGSPGRPLHTFSTCGLNQHIQHVLCSSLHGCAKTAISSAVDCLHVNRHEAPFKNMYVASSTQ